MGAEGKAVEGKAVEGKAMERRLRKGKRGVVDVGRGRCVRLQNPRARRTSATTYGPRTAGGDDEMGRGRRGQLRKGDTRIDPRVLPHQYVVVDVVSTGSGQLLLFTSAQICEAA